MKSAVIARAPFIGPGALRIKEVSIRSIESPLFDAQRKRARARGQDSFLDRICSLIGAALSTMRFKDPERCSQEPRQALHCQSNASSHLDSPSGQKYCSGRSRILLTAIDDKTRKAVDSRHPGLRNPGRGRSRPHEEDGPVNAHSVGIREGWDDQPIGTIGVGRHHAYEIPAAEQRFGRRSADGRQSRFGSGARSGAS